MDNFLSQLPKTTVPKKKRLGRGYGSGVGGHTVGRGQKGQKSRPGSIPLMFTGTKNKKSLVQRLPIMRGKNKFKPLNSKPVIITTQDLARLKVADVNLETLIRLGLVTTKEAHERRVKILNKGRIQTSLTVNQVPVSRAAQAAIEAAGGKVI